MFERFSDRARQTVVLAQEEARRLSHNYIGTEHILLGLLSEGEGIAAQSLHRMGIALADVRADVIRIVGQGSETPTGHIPFTPRSKKVLELSLREALQLGHNYIGTEHILLGLVREGQGVAAQALVARGATTERVRAMVIGEIHRLGASPGRAAPRRTPGAEEAIVNAQQLAGSGPTGTHHLLEALARSEDTLAGRVLASLGVNADSIAVKIDEIGTDGTSDVTPEETGARLMELRIEGDTAHLVLGDATTVAMVRTIIESTGGPVRGADTHTGSLAGLWQAVAAGLEELRNRVAPATDDATSGPARSSLVRQAIQTRLARRRRDA